MVFQGVGVVKWKGKKIANFADGFFEVPDYKETIINRLISLGFKPVEKSNEAKVSEPIKQWTAKQRKQKK